MAVILDHFQHPRNRGTLDDPHVDCEDVNPRCGDRVRLQVHLGPADEITSIRFVGDGCVISMAAASLLTTMVEGRSLQEVLRLRESAVIEGLQAAITPRRYDCALLAHVVLKAGLVRFAHHRRIGSG